MLEHEVIKVFTLLPFVSELHSPHAYVKTNATPLPCLSIGADVLLILSGARLGCFLVLSSNSLVGLSLLLALRPTTRYPVLFLDHSLLQAQGEIICPLNELSFLPTSAYPVIIVLLSLRVQIHLPF
ncbi:hypothetical protein K1719_001897 [Acacia pycnantha]|nr:hypothetical protein K1719_001897 [Acacia pycnantha]